MCNFKKILEKKKNYLAECSLESECNDQIGLECIEVTDTKKCM